MRRRRYRADGYASALWRSAARRWLELAAVRTHHRRAAAADPRRAVAARPTRRPAVATRARSAGWCAGGSPGLAARADLPRAVPRLPVHACSRRTSGLLVSGLCGRIWTLARDYPRLDGAGRVRGVGRARHRARAVRATGSSRGGDGGAELVSRGARAAGRPRRRLRLKALWAVIGPFERLVGAEPLELAAQAGRGRARCRGPVLEPGERATRRGEDARAARAAARRASARRGGARERRIARALRRARARGGCAAPCRAPRPRARRDQRGGARRAGATRRRRPRRARAPPAGAKRDDLAARARRRARVAAERPARGRPPANAAIAPSPKPAWPHHHVAGEARRPSSSPT